MKNTLRLALPRLRELGAQHVLPFVLLDRHLNILRSGELPLSELAHAVLARKTEIVLHPADVVSIPVTIPPLAGTKLQAAVHALVEPITLSPVEQLAIAHSPRQKDGKTTVAWTDRGALARAWTLLSQAGLPNIAFYPSSLIAPTDDPAHVSLALPAGAQWCHPAPTWSLNPPALRPAASKSSALRGPLLWLAAASCIWIVGLNVYASRLASEAHALQSAMQAQVAHAFPEISVVLDPLKQATQRRDALRASNGTASENDAMPLAMSAAKLLPQARNRVTGMYFEEGVLRVDLEEEQIPSAPSSALIEQASAQGILLTRRDNGWNLSRADDAAQAADGPATSNHASGGLRMRQGTQP